MLAADLDKARIPCENSEGLVDVHGLRIFHTTQPHKSNKNPKIIQPLARHSTMELTMMIYAKVNPSDAATAVNGVHIGTKNLDKTETSSNKTKQNRGHKSS
jgi:hypothetical protein